MKTTFKIFSLTLLVALAVGALGSCKKDPSIARIYVKPAGVGLSEGIPDKKVIIIGDVDSNPETYPWVDTVITNQSGFAEFNLDEHFEAGKAEFGKKVYEVAYFNIMVKTDNETFESSIRCRVNTTSVETVHIN